MRWVVAKIGTELLITETGERGISTNYHVTTAIRHEEMGLDTAGVILTTPWPLIGQICPYNGF